MVTWVLTDDVLNGNWMGLECFIYLITVAIRHIIENNRSYNNVLLM